MQTVVRMTTKSRRHLWRSTLVVCTALIFGGCQTVFSEKPSVTSATLPVPLQDDAPQTMQNILAALMRYRAEHGNFPVDFTTLYQDGLMTSQMYQTLPAYAYAPHGLGILQDGRTVLLVDDVIRVPNRAWCIVREGSSDGQAVAVQIALIPMPQLDAAARRASGAQVR